MTLLLVLQLNKLSTIPNIGPVSLNIPTLFYFLVFKVASWFEHICSSLGTSLPVSHAASEQTVEDQISRALREMAICRSKRLKVSLGENHVVWLVMKGGNWGRYL